MKYQNYFVDAFERLCLELYSKGLESSIFYPSTIYVEYVPTGYETYAGIKAQGEIICRNLSETLRLKIYYPRLPKIETDQTRGILDEEFDNPIEVLMPHLLKMKNFS